MLESHDLDIPSQMAAIRELAMLGGRRPMYEGVGPDMSRDAARTGGALRHVLLDVVMERGYGHPLTVAVVCREALGYAGYAAAITASPERPHLAVNRRALDMVGNCPVEPGRPRCPSRAYWPTCCTYCGAHTCGCPTARGLRCITMSWGWARIARTMTGT